MLTRIRPYLKYLRPVRVHFFGALLAGVVFGLATGAGLPLLTEKILPRLLGGGETLMEKEVEPGQEVTIQITSENTGAEEAASGSPRLKVGEESIDSVEVKSTPSSMYTVTPMERDATHNPSSTRNTHAASA